MRHLAERGLAVSHLSHFQSKSLQNETQTPFCVSKTGFSPRNRYNVVKGRKVLEDLQGSRPQRPARPKNSVL